MIDEIIKIEEALEVLGVKKRLDNAEKQIWTPSGVRTVNGEEPDDRGDITVSAVAAETDPIYLASEAALFAAGDAAKLSGLSNYTDEQAQDAVGNVVGNGLDYDDATGAISVDETELTHNSIGSLQGGIAGEYNHLTNAQVSALHAAVTLDANADTLLSLSTQALGLDTQTANTALMGPVSGAAAVPTFRSPQAKDVVIPGGIGTPTYDDVQDFLNTTRSAGRLTGGAVSKGTGATVSITPMEGMIFTGSTLGTSPLIYFKMPQQTDILGTGAAPNLIDKSVNWIYIDYAAGTPVYKATTDRSTISDYTMFTVARAWVSGATVEVQASGHSIYNKDRRSHNRLILKYSGMDRISGAVLSAHATALRLACTGGSWYIANTPYTTAVADTFKVIYKTGVAWTESAELTLFSEVFDGGTSKVYETYQNGNSLAAINGSKYGVYWIFECPEGDLYVVLGTSDYANVGAAQAASIPSSLPPYCVNWSRLIGRVICQKTGAAFYSVESSFSTSFTQSAAVDHASLANLTYATSGHTGFEAILIHQIVATLPAVAGAKCRVRVPMAGTITSAIITGDISGSAVVDIWKDTTANYPPSVADTITASAKPTLSTQSLVTDSTLTGWTKTLTTGDWLVFSVDSCDVLSDIQVTLIYTRN